MGKHKKHHKKHGSSSSSSSSSSGSDDEKKRYKREQKKQKKLMKKMNKHGMAPAATNVYPGGGYPVQPSPAGFGQPGYPQAQGYPQAPAGYPGAPAGYPGAPAGYPGAPAPGYPGAPAGYPGAPAPGFPGAPAPGYPGGPPPQPAGYPQQPGGYAPPPAAPGQAPAFIAPPGQTPFPGHQPPGMAPYNPTPPPGQQPPPYGQPGYQGYPHNTGPQPPMMSGGEAPGQPYQPQPGGVGAVTGDLANMSVYGTAEKFFGTVFPAQNFSAETDSEVLRKAMKGVGTDEKTVVDIMSKRSNAQRQQIKATFKTMYGKDLEAELKSELGGRLEDSVIALLYPAIHYDAWSLRKALGGIGTTDAVLIEILCTRTNSQIREIVDTYKKTYDRDLEKDITKDTSGHFKKLLVSCCQGNRAELSPEQLQQVLVQGPECVIDRDLARKDAQQLHEAGENQLGTDESTFLKVMALRHYYQLRATFEEYQKIANRDITKSLSKEMHGDTEDAFKALVMSVRNRPEYFANRLYKAMHGAGTDDSTLLRVIVSRSEVDLGNIKQEFLTKYGKGLQETIRSDTTGDYRKLLMAIVGQ